MANRYVRIYNGPENMNVVGFSASAVPEKSDGFEPFMAEKGYTAERLDWDTERHAAIIRQLGGVSSVYYGIEPPLKDEDQRELAEWCAEHVDTSHNNGFLIDNRMTPGPLEPFHNRDQEIIAKW